MSKTYEVTYGKDGDLVVAQLRVMNSRKIDVCTWGSTKAGALRGLRLCIERDKEARIRALDAAEREVRDEGTEY